MDLYAPIVRHLIYPAWVKKNGSGMLHLLDEYERSQYLSPDELKAIQWSRLTRLVAHAYEHCYFYRRRFDGIGMHPADLKTPEDFRSVPPLTKTEIQEHLAELANRSYLERELIKDMTGGSTGSPLVFYYDRVRRDSREASRIRHNRWAGWDMGDRVAALWGAPRLPSGRTAKLRNRLLRLPIQLDAGSLSEEKMFQFAKQIGRYRPKVLLAYSNLMDLFAKFVQTNRIEVPRLSGIICTAEVLQEEQRRRIESVFGCPVFVRYGSREVALIASECERHQGLHLNAESLYMEIIREGKEARQNESGEVLITDLLNDAMPLIRYRIGDVATVVEGADPSAIAGS